MQLLVSDRADQIKTRKLAYCKGGQHHRSARCSNSHEGQRHLTSVPNSLKFEQKLSEASILTKLRGKVQLGARGLLLMAKSTNGAEKTLNEMPFDMETKELAFIEGTFAHAVSITRGISILGGSSL